MASIVVKQSVLQWAIDRSGLSAEDLKDKFPKITEWITGQARITLRQLENLAKATSTPLGYFFLENPPVETLPIPFFRTLSDVEVNQPSPDLIDTIHSMQQRQTWMRDFLIEQGQDKLRFVKSANLKNQTSIIAEQMRHLLNFNEDWASLFATWKDALRTLREAMESVGIIVVFNGIVGNNTHRKLDPNEFRGFVLVDDYSPLVFVNSADSKAAQMFTLAHELAHVFLGSSAAFDLREMSPANNDTERVCNSAAAEFLVPQNELKKIWPSVSKEAEPFQAVARRFKVSALVAARRTLDLQFITKNEFIEFYRAYQQDDRRMLNRQSDGGDFYANQNLRIGKKFISAVIQSVTEGKLLYSDAYKLTGLYGKTFEHYLAYLGLGRA